jgi:hypothetical protein
MAGCLLELKQHFRGLKRIAPQLEEVFIHADVGELQQALPDLGDQNLERRGWRFSMPLAIAEALRKLRALDFACRADWQALHNVNVPGHLVVRDATVDEL